MATRSGFFAALGFTFALTASLASANSNGSSDRASAASPRVLSANDVRLYREIFSDESEGQFVRARIAIAELSDRSLMGYVEAEHYLSPRLKHPAVLDLAEWLREYPDLAIASRMHALAEERDRHLRRRRRIELPGIAGIPWRPLGSGYEETDRLYNLPLASDAGRAAQVQIDSYVKLHQPAAAETVLDQLVATNVAPEADIVRLTQRVAASYLSDGEDDAALRLASGAAGAERYAAPLLDWDAGLAAYRLKKFSDAAPYFENLANVGAVPGWTRSAAAFWAARAHLAAGESLPVISLLTAAAREQPTFYGLLAERVLGGEISAEFSDPALDSDSLSAMMRIPAAHRAVALWQVGRTEYIEAEMARAFAGIGQQDIGAFAALSHHLDVPDLELRASEAEAGHGELLTGLFPVPQYTPPGGYHIDPCLVLAFARAESGFRAKAVSTAGARGLMQVLPGTATLVDGTPVAKSQLNDPAYNLGLGERYLQDLMTRTNGNLFQLAAAYNAGPAALTRWLVARPELTDDPLLFIESIPYSETRNYIKHVMTNYWLYAKRTKTDAPTLDETAEGKWPRYRDNGAAPLPASTLVSDATAPY
ncbi:MAG TPA: lytic transglycosylase domain-containing protein [Rhizomicrobium sp.]|nr:lytic transglycosylase domain-containing protein [Rhizomicrobium sp.]